MADIHANLEALEAVLKDSKQQQCTHYAFLGDYVGYCADPKACLEIVRAMHAPSVKGNHDEYCATDLPFDGVNPRAAKLIHWTRTQLNEQERGWLSGLPYVLAVENFTIVHATLDAPGRWGYVFDKLAAAASFTCQRTPLCFFGHTHVPVAFVRDATMRGVTYSAVRGGTYVKFKVEDGKQYFVNVGAVGQPRDNNPKAAYVIYDMDEESVELRRVEYDIAAAKRKILEAGLG